MKQSLLLLLAASLLLTSCYNNDDTPLPSEEELITTVQLTLQPRAAGFQQTAIYKIENGYGASIPGTVRIDSLLLGANQEYDATVTLLNEKASPTENVTNEVISENNVHLFLYSATPAAGAGSIAVSNGNTDGAGKPFNQTIRFTAGAAGNGSLTVTLLHEPTNKSGTTPATAGGETDVEATFPVRIMP